MSFSFSYVLVRVAPNFLLFVSLPIYEPNLVEVTNQQDFSDIFFFKWFDAKSSVFII